jgi:hypothetical protein
MNDKKVMPVPIYKYLGLNVVLRGSGLSWPVMS